MRFKAPPHHHMLRQQDKERRVERFIRQHLNAAPVPDAAALLVVARCCGSPVARALLAAAEAQRLPQVSVRIVLASDDCGLEAWLDGAHGVGMRIDEVRIARNPHLHDAHEQLVLGSSAVWFGDCLRRDPAKRDAFEAYCPHDAAGALRARATFERLWLTTEPFCQPPSAPMALAAAGDAAPRPPRSTARA